MNIVSNARLLDKVFVDMLPTKIKYNKTILEQHVKLVERDIIGLGLDVDKDKKVLSKKDFLEICTANLHDNCFK